MTEGLRRRQEKEATKRIKILLGMGLNQLVFQDWEMGNVCYSQVWMVKGNPILMHGVFGYDGLGFLKPKDELERYGIGTYYGMYFESSDKRLLVLLTISPFLNEWAMEREVLREGYPVVGVYDLDTEEFIFEQVMIKLVAGCFVPVASESE